MNKMLYWQNIYIGSSPKPNRSKLDIKDSHSPQCLNMEWIRSCTILSNVDAREFSFLPQNVILQ